MGVFDREIRELCKGFQVPETYHKKVDDMMETIREDSVAAPRKRKSVKVAMVVAACLCIMGCLFFSRATVAEASFFESFKQTIMDFLGMGEGEPGEMGIESKKEEAASKPDLMIDLQEVVMDTQNIYAVVKITAPPDVEFGESMTFDYFGFCEGANYDKATVVPGASGCTLLEVLDGKKNVAAYVVSVSTDKQVKEGKEVTAFFKDLIADANYEDKPEILVEGIWSLSFTAGYTDAVDITVKGTADMEYSLLGTTALVTEATLLPLGMTVVSDVSNVPVDTLHTSSTAVTVRLKMIDGSEVLVDSPDPEKDTFTSGSSISEYEKKGRTYNKYVCQFPKAVDTSRVLGIYIGDCYVPVKEFD